MTCVQLAGQAQTPRPSASTSHLPPPPHLTSLHGSVAIYDSFYQIRCISQLIDILCSFSGVRTNVMCKMHTVLVQFFLSYNTYCTCIFGDLNGSTWSGKIPVTTFRDANKNVIKVNGDSVSTGIIPLIGDGRVLICCNS